MLSSTDGPGDPKLLSCRLLVKRREYAAARAALEDLLRRQPDCAEAKELLLETEIELVRQAREQSEVVDDVHPWQLRTPGERLAALVAGAAAAAAGLFFVSSPVAQLLRNGWDSRTAMRSSRGLAYDIPAHTLLYLPLVLIAAGVWLVVKAVRAWRRS